MFVSAVRADNPKGDVFPLLLDFDENMSYINS